MAATVCWTELVQALRADGVDVPNRSGPAMAKWIRELVDTHMVDGEPVDPIDEARVVYTLRSEAGLIGFEDGLSDGSLEVWETPEAAQAFVELMGVTRRAEGKLPRDWTVITVYVEPAP